MRREAAVRCQVEPAQPRAAFGMAGSWSVMGFEPGDDVRPHARVRLPPDEDSEML